MSIVLYFNSFTYFCIGRNAYLNSAKDLSDCSCLVTMSAAMPYVDNNLSFAGCGTLLCNPRHSLILSPEIEQYVNLLSSTTTTGQQ